MPRRRDKDKEKRLGQDRAVKKEKQKSRLVEVLPLASLVTLGEPFNLSGLGKMKRQYGVLLKQLGSESTLRIHPNSTIYLLCHLGKVT